MINSYSDIKAKIEKLYNDKSANDFIAICNAALGGKRGLNRTELIRAVASGSIIQIHSLIEPLVENLIEEMKRAANEQDDRYNVLPLGGNEYRLLKIKDKDKYGRGAEDYIINTSDNTCTCPEFTNRLRNMFLPCKHQYMLTTTTASITKLVKLADRLDRSHFYDEANRIDRLLIAAGSDFYL